MAVFGAQQCTHTWVRARLGVYVCLRAHAICASVALNLYFVHHLEQMYFIYPFDGATAPKFRNFIISHVQMHHVGLV